MCIDEDAPELSALYAYTRNQLPQQPLLSKLKCKYCHATLHANSHVSYDVFGKIGSGADTSINVTGVFCHNPEFRNIEDMQIWDGVVIDTNKSICVKTCDTNHQINEE